MTPEHYRGDGAISCADAMESMVNPAADMLSGMQIYWWLSAAKYVWRWPLKNGVEDLDKAIDCLQKLKELS